MQKKFSDGSVEREIFNEIWKFCQKHYIPEHTDEYWDEVIKDQTALCERYKEHPIVKEFTEIFIHDLERRLKQ